MLNAARKRGYFVAQVADEMGFGTRRFERYCLKQFGKSPRTLLRDSWVAEAKRALKETRSVKVVAAELGYQHSQDFSRAFKQYTGITPMVYLQGQEGLRRFEQGNR